MLKVLFHPHLYYRACACNKLYYIVVCFDNKKYEKEEKTGCYFVSCFIFLSLRGTLCCYSEMTMCGWPGIKILGLSTSNWPLCWEPRAKVFSFKAWSTSNYSQACFSYSQEFYLSNVCLPIPYSFFFFLPHRPILKHEVIIMWCELWTRLVILWLESFALSQPLRLTGHYKCQDFLFLTHSFFSGLESLGKKMHNNTKYFLHLLKFESTESGDFACMCHYFTHIYSGK